MYYADEVIEEVRLRNDIVDVISQYVKLQRKGNSYFGLCPFHNEKSPSFSVSRDKQMYYCFGCGAGGNLFTFLMEYENYSFPEAVQHLAQRAGVELPVMEESREAKARKNYMNSLMEIQKLTAGYYYYQLKSEGGARAREYLSGRSLSWETVHQFGLGYSGRAGNHLYRYLKNKGYADQLLKDSGLFQADEKNGMYDKFWNRVIFPIADVQNRVIGFGGRVMGDGKPKYLNSPETKIFDKGRNLYGLNRARSSRKKNLIICEGYMDVIAMHQAGFSQAVASLGTAFTTQQSSILKRYTNEVLLTYDSDEAGVKAALRAIPILREAGLTARIIHMEPYKDPDEFLKAEGAERFQERMDQAESSFSFELGVLERQYDMGEPQSRTAFFRALSGKLLEFEQGIERDSYTAAAAKRYGLSQGQLEGMVRQVGEKTGGLMKRAAPEPAPSGQRRRKREDSTLRAQRLLITWMSSGERMFRNVRKYVEPEEFTDPLCRRVAELLEEQQAGGRLNPASLFQYFTEEEEQKQVAAMLQDTIQALSGREEEEKALQETILRVKQNYIAWQTAHRDPEDMEMLRKIVQKRREIEKLHISLD